MIVNDLQREAATAAATSPQKIVAGAGTGKTRTMVERFAHLVGVHGCDADRILAVTFTNRAAADLRDRVTETLVTRDLVHDRAAMDVAWIGTFHGLCVRLLRDDCYEVGFDRATAVIDQLEERLLVTEVLTALRNGEIPAAGVLEMEALGPSASMKVTTEVFSFIQRMKGRGITPATLEAACRDGADTFWTYLADPAVDPAVEDGDERLAEEEVARLVCATYHEYERRLAAKRMLDFDGILLRLRDALRGNPPWQQRVRDRFQYIIVDEFQDTSKVQLEVLEMLAQPAFANVSVVGDPKQSIYGWRDAQIRNILSFEGHSRRLLINYRSVQPILNLATDLIRKDAQFADEPDLEAHAGAGDVQSVCLYRADTPEEEARFVAEHILMVHAQGTPWSDIAMLTRMRRPPVAFEQELRSHGIPYVTAGGQGFFDREEIKDVMAYLTVIHNPLDDVALVRVLQGPLTRISDGQLHRLLAGAQVAGSDLSRKWDLVVRARAEGFRELADATAAARLTTTLTLIRGLAARRAGMSVGDLVQAVVDETGYATLAGSDRAQAPRRLGNLRKLYRMAADFEASQAFTGLDDFIRYVALHDEHAVEVSEADVSGADAVRFMTVHAAKGLEFPVVFLAHVKPPNIKHLGWLFFDDDVGLILRDLGDGDETRKHKHWLKNSAGHLPKDVERSESRRLMYVGITRARRQLFVSSTRRKDPSWNAVLADTDESGRPRRDIEDDHFRTMALYLSEGGRGTLLDTEPAAGSARAAVAVAAAEDPGDVVALPGRASHAARVDAADGERLTVSFSQLEVLAQCALRYRYMYEWRLPATADDLWPRRTPGSDSAMSAADLGTLVHEVLERFHQPGADDGAGGMARLRALWEEIATVSEGAERATAVWRQTAEGMFERYLPSEVAGMATIATEKEVNLAVDVDDRPVLVRGFIDRLCRDGEGRVWIVDYKTNRSLGRDSLAAYGRQLAIYRRASREVLGLDAGALLVEMRTGAVHRQEEDGWPEVETLLATLVGGDRSAPPDPPCGGCAYWRGCPSSTRRPGNDPRP
jgi:DNA helicase-2/ATP-dependent DNA helicase PcrA